jgi:hypothetical protein
MKAQGLLSTHPVKKTKVTGHFKLRFRVSPSHAGRSRRMTYVSVGTAATVIFTFLAVTFTYTCPGLAFMHASGYSYSTTAHNIKADPCQGAKKDICQSVRDRMLSVQVPSLQFPLIGSQDLTHFSSLPITLTPHGVQPVPYARTPFFLSRATLKPPLPLYSNVLRI